jgi:hypothetical protein
LRTNLTFSAEQDVQNIFNVVEFVDKMRRIYVMFVLLLVVIVGLVYVALRMNFDEKIQKVFGVNSGEGERNDGLVVSHTEAEGAGDENVDVGVDGDGGPGGGGESQVEQSDSCERTISYTMLDFSQEEICNEIQDEICVNKTLDCGVNVQNLDQVTGGDFVLNMYFKDLPTGMVLDSVTQSNYVGAMEVVAFAVSRDFQLPESGGNLGCAFFVESAPSYKVC